LTTFALYHSTSRHRWFVTTLLSHLLSRPFVYPADICRCTHVALTRLEAPSSASHCHCPNMSLAILHIWADSAVLLNYKICKFEHIVRLSDSYFVAALHPTHHSSPSKRPQPRYPRRAIHLFLPLIEHLPSRPPPTLSRSHQLVIGLLWGYRSLVLC
jgi:hypothetical protein